MKKLICSWVPLLLAFAVLLTQLPAQALTGLEIMEKVDARDDGDNMKAEQEMTLIDKKGHKRVRKMKAFNKDKGRDTLRLIFFLLPADVKGTGFLTYDYYSGEKEDDQWLYLPELKKTKRIASSDKSSAFMGSDFSYADMTRRVLDEWKYKLLKEMKVRGKKCWLIEALPKDNIVEDRYGYTRSLVFIRQDIYMPVRAVHWVKDGKKLKYFDMKRIEQIDGIWIGTELDMKTTKNKKTLHRTILKFNKIRFNRDIDENMFTVRQLETGL
ncbi:MAG: outer membrane lipoprotein-sorting protein [Thermodesulfobacteriota bacterium]|nr:outer membrane lipoprotein-sorting protein [Thermodesulfobacteriota bacterium]